MAAAIAEPPIVLAAVIAEIGTFRILMFNEGTRRVKKRWHQYLRWG